MSHLIERFSVPLEQRDAAEKALNDAGYAVLEAEDGGGELDREDRYRAVIVVRSKDDVEGPTQSLKQVFAEAVGGVLDVADIQWRLVSPPPIPRR
jgi:hypothetical protein